jgi:teichuronic acid biosynthesis glycosyltransferase TuaC
MAHIASVTIAKIDSESQSQSVKKAFRVLMVTGIYPTEQHPHSGTFVKAQVDSLIAEGLEVEIIHPKPGPVPLRYASTAIQVFFKALAGRFDVIHGHYGLWCLLSRLQWTTPVVADYLGDDLLGTVKADGSYSKKGAFVAHVSRWLCPHVDAVLVKTEQMKKATSGGNVFVIPDGVNFDLFHPIVRSEARGNLGWDQDRYYVVFANNPEIPVKNFSLARAAIERLHERGMTAELVVANGLPQTKVVEYINASNALILPSIAEGSPNVVREAMACNVPVVATNVGDVAQVIGHTAGCVVCHHDPDALAAGLEIALQHSEPTTGRTDTSHLSSSAVAKQLIAMYEQIANKRIVVESHPV